MLECIKSHSILLHNFFMQTKFCSTEDIRIMALLYLMAPYRKQRNFSTLAIIVSHKHLQFTFEVAPSSENFHDTTVYKGLRFQTFNKLDIKSFILPTNNFQYLHRQSVHSPSVFKGFIKGECIRYARNTTDPTILNSTLNDFKAHLSKRGYSPQEIDPIIKETTNTNRTKLILNKTPKQVLRNPTVLVTKFNPCLKGLKKQNF